MMHRDGRIIGPKTHTILRYCRRIAAIGFIVLCLLPSGPTPAHAMGERLKVSEVLYTRCNLLGVQGSFDMFESRYRTDGMCMRFDDENPSGVSTFENVVIRDEFRWTGESRYESGTRTVLERITVGKEVFESTMVCPQDPWLTQLSQPCANIVDRLVIDRPQSKDDLLTDTMLRIFRQSNPGSPFTSGIREDQRAVLIREYQASRARFPQPKVPNALHKARPPAIDRPSSGSATMMLAPPELMSPVAGNRLLQGTILVKILRSLGGRAEVKFIWLEPGQAPYSKTWHPTMDQLAAGTVAPPEMTDKPGYWEVRVRTSRVNPGPWSQPVRFLVTLSRQPSPFSQQKLPPMNPQNPSPFMQKSPNALPGVTQRLPGQDAALNPQPLPPKAFTPDALSPGIILRRGVDEKALPSKEQKQGSEGEIPAAATPAR